MLVAKLLASAALFVGSALAQGRMIDVLKSDPQYSTLTSLVSKFPDLVSAVSGNAPLTLFAPNNDAFDQLKQSSPDLFKNLTTNDALLKDTLLTHIVLGKALTLGAPGSQTLEEAANKNTLIIFVNPTSPVPAGQPLATVLNSFVTKVTPAAPGSIFTLKSAIVPQQFMITASELFKTIPTISSMNQIISQLDFYSVLDGLKEVTMFVPLNSAINALNQFIKDNNITVTPAILSAIIDSHIIKGALLPTDFRNGTYATAYNGATINLNYIPDQGFIELQGPGNTAPVKASPSGSPLKNLFIAYPLNGVILPDLNKITAGTGKNGINLPSFNPLPSPSPSSVPTGKPYPTLKPYPTHVPTTDCHWPTPVPTPHPHETPAPYPTEYPHETPAPTPADTPYPTATPYTTGDDKPIYSGANGIASAGAALAAAVAAVHMLAL
ncbi:hypothetical protein HK105_209478 [Polyrhizophydium stewartii]|uniref:FAS1 domain-containing protein n=1 Tax=Polyrhizophydium stewartii TaxID=2732419 RepID=A0ABR4MUY9_9FUNG